jgi:hypothetical protein
MQTIYKFGLGTKNNVPVDVFMPPDATVIHIDWDPNTSQVAVWAVLMEDSEKETEKRTFYIAGTGSDLKQNLDGEELMDHYSTFKIHTPLMTGWFHAFEVSKNLLPEPTN